MKLFFVKNLSAAIILPIAFLLSACGGNSDSSGNNSSDSSGNTSDSNGSIDSSSSDKKHNYSLKGYWKSECVTDLDSPTIVYYHMTETNNTLNSEEIIQEFQDKSKNCIGKSEIINNGIFDMGTQKKPTMNVEFIKKDHFLHTQNDSVTNNEAVKTDFHRISESDYNKVK